MQISKISQQEFLDAFQIYLECNLKAGGFALEDAMLYASAEGGKRIRPTLVRLGALSCGDAPLEDVLALAYAVELVHSYSLVHDDLPAMDDDDYRRGKLSVHKKFGEANGILTGDALLTEAARHLVKSAKGKGEQFLTACDEILLGAEKMVNGQVKDIAGCKTREEHLTTYSDKTGALILASFRAGAILAGAESFDDATEYAKHLGLAFQLADDLLDDDGEPSIINAIGRAQTQTLLKEETAKAVEAARRLENKEELIAFVNMLCVRQK